MSAVSHPAAPWTHWDEVGDVSFDSEVEAHMGMCFDWVVLMACHSGSQVSEPVECDASRSASPPGIAMYPKPVCGSPALMVIGLLV